MFLLGVIDPASSSAFHDILHFMTFDISRHFTFHDIWHFTFHVIWPFMSFGLSCHFAFHVIWRFMSFGVSCHLAFHVISVINGHSNHSHQRHHGSNAKVVIEDRCVLKKWLPLLRWIVIGRYCYKSSFGAKNDRPVDDGTLRSNAWCFGLGS